MGEWASYLPWASYTGLPYNSFHASQKCKYDAGKINAVSFLSKKLLQKKNCFAKTVILEFLLSGGQTVDLGSNLRTCRRRSVKIAIKCACGVWGKIPHIGDLLFLR